MEKKLCPTCKKTTNCFKTDDGFLNDTYRCSVCKSEFKESSFINDAITTVGKVGSVVVAGLLLNNEFKKKG